MAGEGVHWTRWFFAVRIWLAVCLAMGVAFWLQLDGASSAGVCVAILAQQTRGQVIEKAIYRMVGTVVGAFASIALAATCSQTVSLYVLAYSAWLGVCVFAAGRLDGNRAYAAVLCGYTVSIVAVPQIDAPNTVFLTAVDRGAAILIGILAITFVNGLFLVPGISEKIIGELDRLRARVDGFCDDATVARGVQAPPVQVAQLLSAIVAQRQQVGLLATETWVGVCHTTAARVMIAALTEQVFAKSRLALVEQVQDRAFHCPERAGLRAELEQGRATAEASAAALHRGEWLSNAPGLPLYQPWEMALRNGLRAFSVSVIAGFACSGLGWSATALAWQFVGIVICLSATAPDPRVLTRGALIAMPLAVTLAGLSWFGILHGADAFPLLCLGLAPALIAGALLATSPSRKCALIGSLTIVFMLVVLSPTNPPSYDPSLFAVTGMLMILATTVVFALTEIAFPTKPEERRRWAVRSAWKALRRSQQGLVDHAEDDEAFLDAGRIAAVIAAAGSQGEEADHALRLVIWLAHIRFAMRRSWCAVQELGTSGMTAAGRDGRATQEALLHGDADALRSLAERLESAGKAAAADLALLVCLLEAGPSEDVAAWVMR